VQEAPRMEAKKVKIVIEEPLAMAVEAVRKAAAEKPAAYLKDSIVPAGGE